MDSRDSQLRLVASHRLDLTPVPGASVRIYRRGLQRAVVVLAPKETPPGNATYVRIQSACLYGELLVATDCDCRDQLMLALECVRAAGGLVIHLDQEGRGAGLDAKARAYEVQQEQGIDTVVAYEQLGMAVDSRDYSIAGAILAELGIKRVKLLTNNVRKEEALGQANIHVERVPLLGTVTDGNRAYLTVKEVKLGHDLGISKPGRVSGSACTVAVVGAAVTDHLFRVERNPRFGQSRQADLYERRPGGKGLNQAVALARLGAAVSLVAEVGSDSDSVAILDALRREGVNALPVQISGVPLTAENHDPSASERPSNLHRLART